MHKEIVYGKEARDKLKSGVDKLAAAVTTTLGLKGRNVAIGKGWLNPQVVHDGVTVAREVILKDPFENIGAQIVREAASKTNESVGDGTTTSTLLAQAIIENAMKVISSGSNAMMVRRGVEVALEKAIDGLNKQAIPIKTKKEKAQVATISAQDTGIGDIVAEAYEMVGEDGMVTFTESNGFGLEIEVKSGAKIESPYASPYFMTDPATQEALIEDAVVLVLDMKMQTASDAYLALNQITSKHKNLVIIGEVEGEALVTLLLNKQRGVLNSLVIKPPFLGTRRKEALEDIAVITGARVVSEELGRTFDSIVEEDLGKADRVVASRLGTVIIGGGGNAENIKHRADQIKVLIDSKIGMEKEQLQRRLAMFSGDVAIINVGASTEGERTEKKLRVEDAVNATKAAIDGGIVAGGGVALYQAREEIKTLKLEGDEAVGAKILYDALDKPVRKIVENAGMEGAEVLSNMRDKNIGFNVLTMTYEDMIKVGVIDPVKVPISALKNAVSVATLVMTTDCIIVPDEEWTNAVTTAKQ